MTHNNISLYRTVNLPEMESAALEVLRSGQIASGHYVKKFEQDFGELISQPNVVSTVDMTSALFLALYLSGVKKGDEVLTTPFACLSTNAAIAQLGAHPVWVDSAPGSVDMDIVDIESKITEKTKAVILYHVAGYPGPAREIAAICKRHGILLIEDCDNALLAERDSEMVGTHADFSVYSFYPNRQINTTEGGALVCRSSELAQKARQLRRFGINTESFRAPGGEINPESDIVQIGWSITLNNLCSALGCAQVATVQERRIKTLANVEKLKDLIRPIKGVTLMQDEISSTPAYWGLLLFVEHRDDVLTHLKSRGISASIMHQRNDVYSGFGVNPSPALPNVDFLQKHILALPCGWWLTNEQISTVASALTDAVNLSLSDSINFCDS